MNGIPFPVFNVPPASHCTSCHGWRWKGIYMLGLIVGSLFAVTRFVARIAHATNGIKADKQVYTQKSKENKR